MFTHNKCIIKDSSSFDPSVAVVIVYLQIYGIVYGVSVKEYIIYCFMNNAIRNHVVYWISFMQARYTNSNL